MNLKGIFKVIAALLLIVYVSGCGDGNSETNGTLTISAEAPVNAGFINMKATALLTPIQTGSEVTFITKMFNSSGEITLPPECSGKRNTDVTGTTTPISCNIQQPTTTATLQISANAGGLNDVISIPIAAATP